MKHVIKLGPKTIEVIWGYQWSFDNRNVLKSEIQNHLAKKSKKYFHSLSHTTVAGGFAICSKPIGFDIEPKSRKISSAAQLRIASDMEMKRIPNILAIWVAKEAAWKSLQGPKQPKTVSKICITGARKIINGKSCKISFKFKDISSLGASGRGLVWTSGRLIMGIATPNT